MPKELDLSSFDKVKKEFDQISKWYYKALEMFKTFLKTVTASNTKDIAKKFELLSEANERLNSLEKIISITQTEFVKEKGARSLLQASEALKQRIDKEYKTAWAALSKISKEGAPPKFISLGNTLSKYLADQFKGRYKTLNTDFQVGVVGDKLHFVCYNTFTKLVDDENYTYPKFIVLLTQICNLKGKVESTYVNTWSANNIPLPGQYRLALESNQDLPSIEKALNNLLSSERMLSVIKPHPIPTDISVKHDAIKDLKVKDGRIFVTFKKLTGKQLELSANAVLHMLMKKLGNKLYHQLVAKTRLNTKKNLLEVVFIAPSEGKYFTAQQWAMVQQVLDLSDKELSQLIKSF